jgi:hypothetical protein
MLLEKYGEKIASLLTQDGDINPIDESIDTLPWSIQDRAVRDALILEGERYIDFQWPPLTATAYIVYSREGDRSTYERPSKIRRRVLTALTLAEAAEGDGRFIDDIINGIWAICEESTWVVPAHNYVRLGVFPTSLADPDRTNIDLFAGETASLLAWIYRLHKMALDRIEPLICRRIQSEVQRRVTDPYMNSESIWWMWITHTEGHHINNWTPWCVSTCLTTLLLLEGVHEQRIAAVKKSLRILDRFLDHYTVDGGCEEGPAYWSHAAGSLLDCLEILYTVSAGKIDIFHEDKFVNMGRYLHRVHIGGAYFVNFADAPARIIHDWSVLLRYADRTDNRKLRQMADEIRQAAPTVDTAVSIDRTLRRLFSNSCNTKTTARNQAGMSTETELQFWFNGIQVMTAKEGTGNDGFYLAVKGGHNDESHNHNDVGSFLIYYSALPILIDPGVPTYSAATFNPRRRYGLNPMRSNWHNLLTIGDFEQRPGRTARADNVRCSLSRSRAEFEAELRHTYPAEAGIQSYRRRIALVRTPTPEDHSVVPKPFIEWTDHLVLENKLPVAEIMMLKSEPRVEIGKLIIPSTGESLLELNLPAQVIVDVEEISLDDSRLIDIWGEHIYRVSIESHISVSGVKWTFTLTRTNSIHQAAGIQ